MSLQVEIAFSVPEQTARIARASFRKGNVFMKMRDELGTFFEDPQFADLFPPQGQPAVAPWRSGAGHSDAVRRRAFGPADGRCDAQSH